MRCSICGAKLKKDGDICSECYKAYQEEEDLKKDIKEQLKVKRKYSISYEFVKYIEIIVIFILSFFVCFSSGGIAETLLVVLLFVLCIGFLLFWDKRVAMATKVTFYEKKVVYKFKFLFFDTVKVIKYSDIKDIGLFQTYRQKRFGYGDLYVYTKGIIPGSGFINGFQIKNVEDVEEVLKKIGQIIGPIEN